MSQPQPDIEQKFRQQYNFSPYPNLALDNGGDLSLEYRFINSVATAYYLRNRQIVQPEGMTILDAGCGTGYKALTLAQANPGAKIIGVDISETSVQLAQQRFQQMGLEHARFEVLSLNDVATLGLQFDYINCDEVLYILPDPLGSLTALSAVLKPEGILRGNLHSQFQRQAHFRAQSVFKVMGLMDDAIDERKVKLATQVMGALHENVSLKQSLGHLATLDSAQPQNLQRILMNLLLQGDKGFTIPDLFSMLKSANLEFVSMVNWEHWNLLDLFQLSPQFLSILGLHPTQLSEPDRLHLYELFSAQHRLLDFWCGRPGVERNLPPATPAQFSAWSQVRVQWHPQLNTPEVKQAFLASIKARKPINLSKQFPSIIQHKVQLESQDLAGLLPLFEAPQSFADLAHYRVQLLPISPVTLEAKTVSEAATELQELLTQLESCLYIFLSW
jgi:2-polyprenyl-3-methyl-5-hydroxy-6-metoxy-1,4-benzoquinol methylase